MLWPWAACDSMEHTFIWGGSYQIQGFQKAFLKYYVLTTYAITICDTWDSVYVEGAFDPKAFWT